jgi:peptidoglycan/LPS O-acetylase OafA/YrhL
MSLLSHSLSRKRNNFDLVRLVAAYSVVYAHSIIVQKPDGHTDFVTEWLGFDYSGSLGVFAFFLLSGLLVTASYDRQRSPARYLILRATRIWPAVAVASLFAIFVMGPLLTNLPLRQYFASSATWANLDSFSTVTLGRRILLPGVFSDNPVPDAMFAPLWTLPVEVRYYVVVLVAGMLGLLKSPRGMLVAVLIGLIPLLVRPYFAPHFHLAWRHLAPLAQGGYGFHPELVFLTGMLLYALREHVDINGWTAVALWAVYLCMRGTPFAQALFYPAFAYGVLWIGTTSLLHRFAPRNDYSFGIYIYGFPVQQTVAHFWPALGHLSALVIATPFVIALAWLSWHGVEKPALNWTRKRLGRTRTHEQPPAAEGMPEPAAR